MTDQGPLRVMVVDDNPVVRSGLVSLLEAGDGVEVVAQAGDGRQAMELADGTDLDLILLDVRMPEVDGVEAVSTLAGHCPVVMLTYTDDAEVVRAAIRGGASGYLVHGTFTAEELAGYVRSAAAGATTLSPPAAQAVLTSVRDAPAGGQATATVARDREALGLSVREAEVMDLIAQGKPNGDIAGELFLSEKTVKNHVNRIYAKLGVTSRAAAIARWIGTDSGVNGGGR